MIKWKRFQCGPQGLRAWSVYCWELLERIQLTVAALPTVMGSPKIQPAPGTGRQAGSSGATELLRRRNRQGRSPLTGQLHVDRREIISARGVDNRERSLILGEQ